MLEKRSAIGLIGLVPFIGLVGCNGPSEPGAEPDGVPVVQLREHAASLLVGDSIVLQLLGLPLLPPGYVPPVRWSSSNPSVVAVSAREGSGAVARGLLVGEAFIAASGEGARDSILVTVAPRSP